MPNAQTPRRQEDSIHSDARIRITTELATTIGDLANAHPDGNVLIRYESDRDPENHWRVTVEDRDGKEYRWCVNDETGRLVD